jgi:hypothetical protein
MNHTGIGGIAQQYRQCCQKRFSRLVDLGGKIGSANIISMLSNYYQILVGIRHTPIP